MKRDTVKLNSIIEYYENTEQFFWTVSECEMNKEQIGNSLKYIGIAAQERIFRIDKNGFQKLKSYSNTSEASKNNLDFDVINFYSSSKVRTIITFNKWIHDIVKSNITYWRDNYDWLNPLLMQEYITDEAYAYFGKSKDYKNRVAFQYQMIYKNYLPLLKTFRAKSRQLLKSINAEYEFEETG